MAEDHDSIYQAFAEAVNMAPAELERFLDTDDSKRVGWKGADGEGAGESVGHRSGRRIVAIKRTRKADLTDDDYAHMKTVVAYVRRHLAQGGPAKDKAHSDWRYSLMNWGTIRRSDPRPEPDARQAATLSSQRRLASARASSTGSGRPK